MTVYLNTTRIYWSLNWVQLSTQSDIKCSLIFCSSSEIVIFIYACMRVYIYHVHTANMYCLYILVHHFEALVINHLLWDHCSALYICMFAFECVFARNVCTFFRNCLRL